MLKCTSCSEEWRGHQWTRKDGREDYRCSVCGSKRIPRDYAEGETTTKVVGTIRNSNKVKDPSYFLRKQNNPKNILVIPDLHQPFTHKDALGFCKEQYDRWDCDHVIFLGDLIDNHYSSFHDTDPDGYSAGDELTYTINRLSEWSEVFPEADVVMGNHDRYVLKKAYSSGISKRWIKDFNEVLRVNWNFYTKLIYNKTLFIHGEGMKAAPKAGTELMNVVAGHHHTEAYVTWRVGTGKKIFGMQAGSLIDSDSYAMAYAQNYPRQVLSCGLVLDYGQTAFVKLMEL